MAIEVTNLKYTYPDGRVGIEDINLSIPFGKKTAILGLNGSGKSTLLYHFNGMNMPQAGSVKILGQNLNEDNLSKIRRQVGFLFDYPDHQLFSTTAYRDIQFGLDNYKFPDDEKDSLIRSIASDLGITELLELPPYQLSLGQKKKVAIAGIMVLKPEILVCDEPFSGLDYPSIVFVKNILDNWTKTEKTIVFSTHDVNLAYEWADYTIVMKSGRVLCAGETNAILKDPYIYELTELEKPILVELFSEFEIKPKNLEEAKSIISKL